MSMQTPQTQHQVSEFLADRHPFLPQAKSDRLEVCRAYGRRGIAKLTEILRLEDYTDDEKCAALHMIWQLLGTQELKLEAIENGAIAAATALLADGGSHPNTRTNAALVLGSLALLMQGRSEMAAAGSVPVIASSCQDKSETVRVAAAEAIANVVRFRDGWSVVASGTKTVGDLVKALPANPHVVAAFVPLTALFYEGTEIALAAGVMPKLVGLLRSATETAHKKDGCMALRNLANNDDGKDKAINTGAVDVIIALLPDPDTEVRQVAAGALLTLSVALEAKQLFMDGGQKAVDDLAALLRDESAPVRHNATVAIRTLSELPVAKAAFCRALVHDLDLVMDVFRYTAAAPLCDLLAIRKADVRASATAAVHAMTRDAEGIEATVGAVHIVPRLAAVLASPESTLATQKLAAQSIVSLAKAHSVEATRFAAELKGENATGLKAALVTFPELGQLAVSTLKK